MYSVCTLLKVTSHDGHLHPLSPLLGTPLPVDSWWRSPCGWYTLLLSLGSSRLHQPAPRARSYSEKTWMCSPLDRWLSPWSTCSSHQRTSFVERKDFLHSISKKNLFESLTILQYLLWFIISPNFAKIKELKQTFFHIKESYKYFLPAWWYFAFKVFPNK